MIIAKTFEFEASHQLPPDKECYGACRRLHGHTYKLIVEIEGEIDREYGWLINFKDLKQIVNKVVIDKYDHQHLNDFFEITTAEVILEKIVEDLQAELDVRFNGLYKLHSCILYETSTSYAKWIRKS